MEAPEAACTIPHELPLFPVQPIGVFLPGMTKTLHLYEPHFISLVEECLATPHRLMATAVLEPYMGGQAQGQGQNEGEGPGSFIGGNNYSLSCGCLVQVLSAKPYTGGYLVRIRGEARLGISGLPQSGPYMRAQVYPLPDHAVAPGEAEGALRAKAEELDNILRDAQNLASKFRCDETAALQQAMRWRYAEPLTPGIAQAPAPASAASSSSTPDTLSVAEGGPAEAQRGAEAASTSGRETEEEEGEEEVMGLEELVRLSWAALQWLPHATAEERMRIVRSRLLAMDTRDVGRRLELAAEAMGEAAAALAAKCALASAGGQGQGQGQQSAAGQAGQ
ncbi:hypothetical protein HYH03_009431 [Edaphochlamys debaryana]|uniref:Lon N-terminal domain-containing protein n=1 Tax=Edaphochlamys debaryana TaxID=47281 RepID=A0A835XXT4_9CHLO|nr:hypothetical protein HYH03_009431 [Edaphochlamys debaryana]|eukprot:KAG2492183.1 hypothetical protein HYH03_009431 [Edaphochlamys debaryana]